MSAGTSDESELLVKNKQTAYGNVSYQRQSSRLEWIESSWTRWWYIVTWWWMNPILSLGYKRTLTDDDLDDLSYVDKSSTLLNQLYAYDYTTMTTWNIIVRAFWKPSLLSGLLLVPRTAVRITKVVLLRQIVLFINSYQVSSSTTSPPPTTIGYLYAVALLVCIFVETSINYQFLFRSARISLRVRNALTSIIYARLLSINTASLQQKNAAQIMNFIAQDASKFESFVGRIHYIWQTPFEAVLVFGFLCWIIGLLSAVLSYITLLLLIPVQMLFSRQFSRYSNITTTCADKRMHAFNELINGCHIIRMYNWEKLMEERVHDLRQQEFVNIQQASRLRALNLGLFFVSLLLLALAAFGGAWLTGYPLKVVDIFTALAFFGQIRMPVTRYLPQAIEKLSQMRIATKRIDEFMRLPTIKQQTLTMYRVKQQEPGTIIMRNASLLWHISDTTLLSLNIEIESGTLVGITGSVGSGKSSLLAAILGEMNLINGEIYLNNSSFSYAPQSAWIFADTLRANILLGKPFDEQRYTSVLHACCLDFDLIAFGSSGDLTMIGEKGVNLSGGQRARVSLARALYVDADIYLLDDPFAAVDGTVAKRIYDQCIGSHGLLSKKTRLLVTHQTKFLTESHQTILLAHGRIQAQGRFDELPIERENSDPTDGGATAEQPIEASMLEIGKSTVDTKSIIVDEASLDSGVNWSLLCSLFTASPLGYGGLYLLIFLLVIGEILYDGTNYWLRTWSKQFYGEQRLAIIYLALTLATVFVGLVRAQYFFHLILSGSNRLHSNMLSGLLYTSMRFFESTPSGRIFNRASRDQHLIDELLPATLFDGIQLMMMTLGSVTIIGIINPWVLLILVPSAPLCWILSRFYLRSTRQLKRLENASRSPIYTLFSSSLNGLIPIRAFKVKDDFIQSFLNRIDTNTRAYMIRMSAGYWLCFHLDFLTMLFSFFTAVTSVALWDEIDSSAVALSLVYSIHLPLILHASIRQLVDAEILMTSAERIDEYVRLPREEDNGGEKGLIEPPTDWPNRGAIEFRNYSLRYRPNLKAALKNINLHISPGEKIGIIGRTGAGKSSLFQSIFRLVDRSTVDGEIFIDDIDISRITLNYLRSHISVIPQQPVLFSDTLRYNLDPFNHYSDEQCWEALEAVQLKEMAFKQETGLLLPIAESGSNLSVGQCQLICVARAILKQSKILLIDEATANVDQETDKLLQAVIAEKCRDRTVLTIAHRLNTVAGSDRLLVLDNGIVANFDKSENILPHYQ